MEQIEKQIKTNENNDQNQKNKKNDNNIVRLDSPVNDNESNIILFKYNNLKSENKKTDIKEEKNNNIISHDKEIMEDSIIYFTQKLKKNNIEYHKYLYISIGLYFIDIIIYYFDRKILYSKYNIYSLLIILGISIFQVYAFRHNFESISKEIYICIQRIIYLYCISMVFFLLNLLYITLFKILLNSSENIIILQKRMIHIFGLSLIIFLYIILNFVIPIIILDKLISIKRNIKSLSAAKGEVYETVKIKDSQIMNSIIN